VLGAAGQIYGQRGQIHFEIVCDGANLEKLIGRRTGSLTAAQGRTDAIYGDIWFKVPKGAKLFANQPHPYRRDDSEPPLGPHPSVQPQQPVGMTGSDLIIRMQFGPPKGDCMLTTFRLHADGTCVEVGERKDDGYEYGLYKEATRLNAKYTDGSTTPASPSPKAPSPSLIYEMLRFGRPVGETMPPDVKFGHWRKIVTPDGTGWINLNQPTIGVYSDADFPPWAGWSVIDDDSTPDSLCHSPIIRTWLDLDGDGHVTHAEAEQALHNTEVKKRMAKAICRFPIEWTKQDIEARWGWLKTPHEALPTPLTQDDFEKLTDHIEALTFWEDITDSDLPPAAECWHFPPKAFVEQFRKCGWLSMDEVTQSLPRRSVPTLTIHWAQAFERFSVGYAHHRSGLRTMPAGISAALNCTMRKYLFLDPLRRAHFFAQIFQETGAICATVESGDARYFRTMYELLTPQEAADDFDHRQDFLRRVGFLRGRDRAHYVAERPREVHEKAVSLGNVRSGDGFRFRGRGLIHLTGRNNYVAYGMYRNKDYAVDPAPDLLMTDAAVAADSAAWYWVSKPLSRHQTNIHRVADAGGSPHDVIMVSRAVNGGGIGLSERQIFFQYLTFIFGDITSLPINVTRQEKE
jgi:hydroxyethylthiazole kinase